MRGDREYRVLVVEDSPSDEALTCRGVHMICTGMKVVVARTATEALQWLSAEKCEWSVDLILLDLRLPPCGGMEFLRALRSDAEVPPVPVVVFGSSVQQATVREAYAAGANVVIEKPIDPCDYMDRVRTAVSFFCGLASLPEKCSDRPAGLTAATVR